MPTRSSIAGLRQPTIEREHGWSRDSIRHGPGTVKQFMDLWGQEKVSWFLPIRLPIDLNFRIHHVDQQVHCPFEGLPQYRTQGVEVYAVFGFWQGRRGSNTRPELQRPVE